ncbi:MAG: glycosyltransferase family 2 protein [Lachnospiraceae bacterium]|nr:glycosyltransferase family 2 protein [Lachnospiraceae bacterium]
MTRTIVAILSVINIFFLIYLLIYATYLFASVVVGAWKLYCQEKMRQIKNEIRHEYYFPISILVPAYNEEVTIVESVESLMNLDYKLYEIIVVDDGSKDDTAAKLIKHFDLHLVDRPIRKSLPCKEVKEIYESEGEKVKLTLIRKKNGGKGDSLNMGINASQYPYFVCIDADSMLQRDSLKRIVQPVMEDDKTVAVGGLIRVAQCIMLEKGEVVGYRLPWNMLMCMQVMEYDRSFLASRILLDQFNGNLIISGAFGLFKKDIIISAGGYDCTTLGEDMELVVRIHKYCKNNQIPYTIRYEPNAICWSQAPGSLKDLRKQRRRWHLGLFQSLVHHRDICLKNRFGSVGSLSYLYYLLYELMSPFIELFGWGTMIISVFFGVLNVPFMISFYLLYALYCAVLSITAFFQRIYTQNLKISRLDVAKAMVLCVVENVFFRMVMDFIRVTAFVGYRKKKGEWGSIKRVKNDELS